MQDNVKKQVKIMIVRFVAEILDDKGNPIKAPIKVETDVPDVTEFTTPAEFYRVFDSFEKPVIEARNQIASEVARDYLDEAAFLKDEGNKPGR